MKATIAILPGDGIGPEVMAQAVRVLNRIAERYDHNFEVHYGLVGGAAFEKTGVHLPQETATLCRAADAVLFGSVGGPVSELHLPKWQDCEANSILTLRKEFHLHANLRPITVYPELAALSPLRDEVTAKGIDLLIVRELSGDIYFGEHRTFIADGRRSATDMAVYDERQIAAIATIAFEAAKQRRGRLCSVHKANVLATSKLWRTVVREIAAQYPEVALTDMLVDNCAMQIVKDPGQFDVIVTSNMFGDILSDVAAVLPGSLGLTPSASLTEDGFGLYEPSGGSAQDIAGRNIANPIAQILSLAMLLRYSLNLNKEAEAIEAATRGALAKGCLTKDLCRPDQQPLSTEEFTTRLLELL